LCIETTPQTPLDKIALQQTLAYCLKFMVLVQPMERFSSRTFLKKGTPSIAIIATPKSGSNYFLPILEHFFKME
jgi:hypothetical protein